MTWTNLEDPMTTDPAGIEDWLPPPLEAVAAGHLRPHYQPVLDAADGHIVAFEALLRWDDPVLGPLPASRFAPWIETGPDAPAVDRWLVAEACREAATWPSPVGVSVNVLPQRLASSQFVRDLRAALASSGLEAGRLTLELVERAPVLSHPSVTNTLDQLRGLGVQVVLDDFLVHYSSLDALDVLHGMAVAAVKLDQRFVAPLNRGEPSPIAEAVVRLAHELDLAVVAEGIETIDGEAGARALGCDRLQGFLYSPAVAPDRAWELLDEFPRPPAAEDAPTRGNRRDP